MKWFILLLSTSAWANETLDGTLNLTPKGFELKAVASDGIPSVYQLRSGDLTFQLKALEKLPVKLELKNVKKISSRYYEADVVSVDPRSPKVVE